MKIYLLLPASIIPQDLSQRPSNLETGLIGQTDVVTNTGPLGFATGSLCTVYTPGTL